MTQYLFATESYPFTADIVELLSDARDSAVLITKDVHHTLSTNELACFNQVIEVQQFDIPHLEGAFDRIKPLDCNAVIISHDDFFYELFATIASRRGLECYSVASILPFVNKHEMKRRLLGSGIGLPQYVLFNPTAFASDSEAYIGDLELRLGFPMFAKPLQGAGSELCAKFQDRADLISWCERTGHNSHFEIDEFVDEAVLYHCDSIIRDGRVVFTQASRYSNPCAAFAQGQPVGSYTLRSSDEISVELCTFAGKVISQFSKHHPVPDGVTHMEMFRRASGELIFLEVQFRPPGANVKRSYALHLGANLEEVHFRLQMRKPIPPVLPTGPYTAWMYFPTCTGQVSEVRPLPKLNSRIIEEGYYVKPGQLTTVPQSILDARGRGVVALSLVFANPNYQELVADFERISSHQPAAMCAPSSNRERRV